MKHLSYIFIIFIAVNSFVSCSKRDVETDKTLGVQEMIVIDDGYKTGENGDIIIDDQDIKGKTLTTAAEQSEESTKINVDGSQVKVMKDGYGNKTISRFFYNHPLISGIVTRISVKGDSSSFIYTKDGLVKKVKNLLADAVQSASANEIAIKVGISTLRREESYRPMPAIQTMQNDNLSPLEDFVTQNEYPLPAIPEYKQNTKTSELENVETSNDTREEKSDLKVTHTTFLNEFESKEKQRKLLSKEKSKE